MPVTAARHPGSCRSACTGSAPNTRCRCSPASSALCHQSGVCATTVYPNSRASASSPSGTASAPARAATPAGTPLAGEDARRRTQRRADDRHRQEGQHEREQYAHGQHQQPRADDNAGGGPAEPPVPPELPEQSVPVRHESHRRRRCRWRRWVRWPRP